MPAGLADLLREHATATGVPGAVIGVLCDGEVEIACHGVTDARCGEAVLPDTPFAVGSLTKSMVATVVAGLAEAGRLSLDDPVGTHVPELRSSDWAARATVRDVMANRSGLPLQVSWEFDFEGRPEADDGALGRLVSDVATGPAVDDLWSYSNAGWCVLGRLVETVTGLAWEEAMQLRLEAGGMRETSYRATSAVGCAVGHVDGEAGPEPVVAVLSRAYAPAGTTTMSTAADLLRLAAWHLDDDSLAPLRETHADVRINGWLDAWCLGWARFDWAPHQAWGWDGLIDGQRSFLRLVPELRAALVLLTNSSTGRAMYRALVPRLVEDRWSLDVPHPHLEPCADAAGDLARFAGIYAWPDRRVVVRTSSGCLLVEDEDRTVEAWPVDDCAFLVDPSDPDNPTLTFGAFDAVGRPGVLYDMLWGLPRVIG